jgi:hypothetical protein
MSRRRGDELAAVQRDFNLSESKSLSFAQLSCPFSPKSVADSLREIATQLEERESAEDVANRLNVLVERYPSSDTS